MKGALRPETINVPRRLICRPRWWVHHQANILVWQFSYALHVFTGDCPETQPMGIFPLHSKDSRRSSKRRA